VSGTAALIERYHALLLDGRVDDMRAHLARAVAANPAVHECRVLRPYFIDADRYARTLEVTALLNDAFIAAARRLRSDHALRRSLGIPVYLDELLALDAEDALPSVMTRIDGMFTSDGTFKILEYNAQPEFGPARAIDDMFASSPMAAEIARHNQFETLRLNDYAIDALLAACGSTTPTIGVPPGKANAREWFGQAASRGCRICVVPYERYRFEGGKLVVDDEGGSSAVDMVAPSWRDLSAPTDAMKPLMDAVRAGAVRTLDGVSLGLLCSYKHTLEILSDPAHAAMFEPAVAAVLTKHVPWTRVVRERKTSYAGRTIDLAPFVAQQRERFVLKPSGGARGEGVTLGRLVDDATWKKTLARALKQPYVVQEIVHGETQPYAPSTGTASQFVNALSDFNPFVWNGREVRGSQVRLTTTGKHVSNEAWVTGVWVVESEESSR
jgi:hypothetical protein